LLLYAAASGKDKQIEASGFDGIGYGSTSGLYRRSAKYHVACPHSNMVSNFAKLLNLMRKMASKRVSTDMVSGAEYADGRRTTQPQATGQAL
jgi:hypothetical protein